jgi:protein TonB
MDANFVDQPAHSIYQAVPEYPRALRKRGIMGFARIEVVVDTIGRVQTARVLVADHPAFAEAATRAALDWMFEPAMMDSEPVAVKVTIPFRFVIPSLLVRR